ncbi:MAG: hypothetical protein JW983_06070 [Elusimicrobia bacterium]|nr:hypothetical protein [Elusimicrobiota bacterium]
MKKKLIIAVVIIGVISTPVIWSIYNYYNPSTILIAVPNDYCGKLIIKEDIQEGRRLNAAALENYGDYVYELSEIDKGTAFVENITFLLNCERIIASKMSIAALGLKVLSKNEDERYIIVEILN